MEPLAQNGLFALSGGIGAQIPALPHLDRSVIVLVTFTEEGPRGSTVTARLDIQKRMFIDKIPNELDPKRTADMIVDRIRAQRY